jgi:acyl-coenzyme A synthetase/AMP-(fatty) acid ligase
MREHVRMSPDAWTAVAAWVAAGAAVIALIITGIAAKAVRDQTRIRDSFARTQLSLTSGLTCGHTISQVSSWCW